MFERTKAKGAISLTTSRSKKERVDWVCDRPFLDLDRSPGKTPFFLSRLHETNPENDHTPTFHSQPQEQEHAKSRPGESKGGAKERDEGKARERKTRRVPLLSPPSTPLISLPLSLFDSPPKSHAYPRTHKTGRAERLPRQGLGRKEEDHDDGERKKSASFFISVCFISLALTFFFPSLHPSKSIKTKSNSKGLHERLPTLRRVVWDHLKGAHGRAAEAGARARGGRERGEEVKEEGKSEERGGVWGGGGARRLLLSSLSLSLLLLFGPKLKSECNKSP